MSDIVQKLGLDLSEATATALASADEEISAMSILEGVYGDEAGQEALLRALMAERRDMRALARFWSRVFLRLEAVRTPGAS